MIYNVNKGKPALTRETYWPLLITFYSRLFGRDLFYSLYKRLPVRKSLYLRTIQLSGSLRRDGRSKGKGKGKY